MTKDENAGCWMMILGGLAWPFGALSFGVTGGNIFTVLFGNLSLLLGPFVFLFGVYLMVNGVLRLLTSRRAKGASDEG